MSLIVRGKWTAKRILALLAALVVTGLMAYLLFRNFRRDPILTAFGSAVIGIFFAIIMVPASRDFIARHPRAVRIAGLWAVVAGIGCFVVVAFAGVRFGESKIRTDADAFFYGPFFSGDDGFVDEGGAVGGSGKQGNARRAC